MSTNTASGNISEPINTWLCGVCHSAEHFPMMITVCGHTFCEDCLNNVGVCPICRIEFSIYDCQPNYTLVKENGVQPVRRDFDIDTQIRDLVRIKNKQIKHQVNQVAKSILDQVHSGMIKEPEKSSYRCEIDGNIGSEILQLVQEKLESHGLVFIIDDVTEELIKITLKFKVKVKRRRPVSSGANNITSTNTVPSTNYLAHVTNQTTAQNANNTVSSTSTNTGHIGSVPGINTTDLGNATSSALSTLVYDLLSVPIDTSYYYPNNTNNIVTNTNHNSNGNIGHNDGDENSVEY